MPGVLDVGRTHPQRLLPHETPLTKENRVQFVTEESLTFFRDGLRCLPPVLWPWVSRPGSLGRDVVGRSL